MFYASKTNDRLNREPFHPELVGHAAVMLNPYYPIKRLARVAPWHCDQCDTAHTFPRCACDSSSFQHIAKQRWFPWQALNRQLQYEEQLRWWLNEPDFHFERVFIYDDPAGVDEAVVNGKKVKVRGTHETAAQAVKRTLEAAHYYATQRERIGKARIAWVGQGIDPEQYAACVAAQLEYMQSHDVFGFGGFCIIGRMPTRMMPVFAATLERIVPMVRETGVTRFHLLGVMYPPAVRLALDCAARYGCEVATDGSGPEQSACISGAVYRADGTQDHTIYKKAQKYVDYHPCALAIQNIHTYAGWLERAKQEST